MRLNLSCYFLNEILHQLAFLACFSHIAQNVCHDEQAHVHVTNVLHIFFKVASSTIMEQTGGCDMFDG